MSDLIDRQAAIDTATEYENELREILGDENELVEVVKILKHRLIALPSVQPDIIRCKDCKFYTSMNRETKTGICGLLLHQNFGDDWYCAGAERRTDEH